MIIILFFALGTIVGSFVNVLVYRFWEGEDIVVKRSHCRNCGTVLSWHELIPVFSFLCLRGKCRTCQAPISWQYPLVEIATGALFALIAQKFFSCALISSCSLGFPGIIIVALHLFMFTLLVAMFVFDVRYYILPNSLLYLSSAAAALIYLLQPSMFLEHFAGALVATAFLGFLVLVTKEKGMGWGDAYLVFPLGFLVGWPAVFAGLLISFLAGSVWGVALLALKRKTLKSPIPFGPFLIASFLFVFFLAPHLSAWYLSFFEI